MIWQRFLEIISNPYIIILLVLCVLVKIFYPKMRGFMGEFWVRQELNALPKEKYVLLNNIMLKQDGKTHQIDHIVISPFGIFVIETKNYYGLIIGDEYKDKWFQCLGKAKRSFQNPIHQNYGHIKALEELLGFDEKVFISVICFSNQARLKVKAQKSTIVQLDNLISAVAEYKEPVLDADINSIKEKISNSNIVDKSERTNHVKNIKATIKENKEKENNMICPKCGGNLVVRKGRYGEFIGCSNYPKCRFKK